MSLIFELVRQLTASKTPQTQCNYDNNYYGDQQCTAKPNEAND